MARSSNNPGHKVCRVTISGTGSMLMSNGQMVDPRNKWVKLLKEQTKGRNKTDDTHEEISRIEFQGRLYWDDKMGPYIPGTAIEAMLRDAAKKRKLGKAFVSAVETNGDMFKLEYKGPRDRDGLWGDENFSYACNVKVGTAKVVRTRPKFTGWTLTFDLVVQVGEVNTADVEQAIETAGMSVGLGDYRPKFGKFTVSKIDWLAALPVNDFRPTHGRAGMAPAGIGWARSGSARHGLPLFGGVATWWRSASRSRESGRGTDWRGRTRSGGARCGRARHGLARHGSGRLRTSRDLGAAWLFRSREGG